MGDNADWRLARWRRIAFNHNVIREGADLHTPVWAGRGREYGSGG